MALGVSFLRLILKILHETEAFNSSSTTFLVYSNWLEEFRSCKPVQRHTRWRSNHAVVAQQLYQGRISPRSWTINFRLPRYSENDCRALVNIDFWTIQCYSTAQVSIKHLTSIQRLAGSTSTTVTIAHQF
ncbi:hypothetical protein A0H81_01269 [Grifola frondosa]|uniref:Uncharacterized protein n=1 Tax=Grifola frondosa TaxID=5627 RepID=A0A1C7MRA0_GRIFR|nr:hypothetical protein A0H81_01269 [Grifola frondosa]